MPKENQLNVVVPSWLKREFVDCLKAIRLDLENPLTAKRLAAAMVCRFLQMEREEQLESFVAADAKLNKDAIEKRKARETTGGAKKPRSGKADAEAVHRSPAGPKSGKRSQPRTGQTAPPCDERTTEERMNESMDS